MPDRRSTNFRSANSNSPTLFYRIRKLAATYSANTLCANWTATNLQRFHNVLQSPTGCPSWLADGYEVDSQGQSDECQCDPYADSEEGQAVEAESALFQLLDGTKVAPRAACGHDHYPVE